jgi:hypothetical protein
MRTAELVTAAAPVAAALPVEAPWPVVLVVGVTGPLVLALLGVLKHRENMAVIKKATTAQLPNIIRWIRCRPRWRTKDDSG